MPIIKSAKKQMRSSARKRVINVRRRKTTKEAIKAVHAEPNATTLSAAFKALDKSIRAKTVHRNKAARLKSRLSKKLKAA